MYLITTTELQYGVWCSLISSILLSRQGFGSTICGQLNYQQINEAAHLFWMELK